MTKPLRLVFGPTGQDPVKLLTEDGCDLAKELPIISIGAKLAGCAEMTEVVLTLENVTVDMAVANLALSYGLPDDEADASSHVNQPCDPLD